MVTITNHTKLSEIILANPDSIDAIAAIAKPLEKLKNPLLRKLMASRITLSEAAHISGCDLDMFRQALMPLGFSFDQEDAVNEKEIEKKPQWLLNIPHDKISSFDVRPLMEFGDDPLKAVVKKFGAITDGEVLCIINSFVPYPLISLLAGKSLTFTEQTGPSEHHTWLLKRFCEVNPSVEKTLGKALIMDDETSFAAALANFPEPSVKRIDVRHLLMPAPMQTILDALTGLSDSDALYVYHKKVPVYLLEELHETQFGVHVLNLPEGEVRLLIYKNGLEK